MTCWMLSVLITAGEVPATVAGGGGPSTGPLGATAAIASRFRSSDPAGGAAQTVVDNDVAKVEHLVVACLFVGSAGKELWRIVT